MLYIYTRKQTMMAADSLTNMKKAQSRSIGANWKAHDLAGSSFAENCGMTITFRVAGFTIWDIGSLRISLKK